ncbi:MAG: fructosamine kinase family protein [Steroidobacteraceae bacterium]|jgi:fructosamine-3-kinase|nr:fructosamine kinase family protein [Steroidobacteraceae bacterium]
MRAGAAPAGFLKRYPPGRADQRDAEIEGLEALAATGTVAVPAILEVGEQDGTPVLLLERLEGADAATQAAGEAGLGAALARLHACHGPAFGWDHDNFIGAGVQRNGRDDDWARFFRERRLRPQLEWLAWGTGATRDGATRRALLERGARLLGQVATLLAGHRPAPALLHGDLWCGNWLVNRRDGRPYVFDPAVYHGDPDADLAMTELFGGFGPRFRAAYHRIAPQRPGYPARRELYNLYHLLNHANLFGEGYARQALAAVDRLLASALTVEVATPGGRAADAPSPSSRSRGGKDA